MQIIEVIMQVIMQMKPDVVGGCADPFFPFFPNQCTAGDP